MTEQSRLAHVLLAVAGTVAAHFLAYAAVGAYRTAALDTAGGHAYLASAGTWVAAVGAATMVWLAVGATRRASVAVDARRLAAFQVLFFGAQELLERVAQGHSPLELLSEPAVLVGLALQPLIAWILVAIVGLGRRVASWVALVDPQVQQPIAVAVPHRTVWTPPAPMVCAVGRRGPPLLIVTA